ncbi:TPA: hypothetical protein ACK3Q6_002328 [Burkholderia cepacia]|nr:MULTISPECIES: hypothetical protein [Burkholderia]HDR9758149.1 hypothetical protein [Burkholderia cepacia ATCC 25416]MBY4708717.1 hypothetical protein [Burkholderia cepacia]MBY4735772.1 hypothetical protein [Burkholderia cepacia]MBY4742742.1 hypothetical protein [Burkholderia cepacia]MBY4756931.1 hypothetical protein [Burkholderia cepacia]
MTQSMIGWVVGLAAIAVIAVALARRYQSEHSRMEVIQWLDSHHLGWTHRKH